MIRSLLSGLSQQALDDYDVAPHAIQFAVPPVDSNFAKSQSAAQLAAGRVLDEDARDQFPQPCSFSSFEQRFHRCAADPEPSVCALDIDGELRDPGIAVAAAIERSCSKGDNALRILDHNDREAALELRA